MTLAKLVRIMAWIVSDGAAASFDLNLTADPFWLGQARPGGIGGRVCNWFVDRAGPAPVGVIVIDGATSASLDIPASSSRSACRSSRPGRCIASH